MASRMGLCLRKQRKHFAKTFVGVVFFRKECSSDSHLLPLLMVPTSVMGLFTGTFLWVFVGFLWDREIRDFMQFMAAFSVIVTFILEFVSFGFAMSQLDSPKCDNPFYGYSIGMPLTLGILFILLFVVFGFDRCKNSKTQPQD
ncbi:uncharacterized protein LOC125678110 isoform X2 [Ostrea edulis]|uniref:uncharacterized protein LOC125678110 isoform X2 n=1 Tax=Ostrea edulis TaxID=37623 RepID=UPI0024AEE8D5|nr:uncharacterized protein LOC125678110 isoform X2 [Ostrea edulis]